MTLQQLNSAQSMYYGPGVINANFTAIETAINDYQAFIDPVTKKVALVSGVTIPNASVAASTLVAAATSGIVISSNPNGAGVTFSVTFDGKISGVNVTLSGTGASKSTIAEAAFTGAVSHAGKVTFTNDLDLLAATMLTKASVIAITTVNIGPSAATKVNLSTQTWALFDCNNSNTALVTSPNEPLIEIDTTTLKEGQVIRMQLYKGNTNYLGNIVKFYNGGSGTEVFAKIVTSGGTQGFVSYANTVYPQFNTGAGNDCWMNVRWSNIGGGTMRLVVIDYKNMLNL